MLVELTAEELLTIHRGLGRLMDRQSAGLKMFESLQCTPATLVELADARAEYDQTVALRVKVRSAMNDAVAAQEVVDVG